MEQIIHQIWVGPYEMPDIEKEYVNSIKINNPSFEHVLWTNQTIPTLPDKLQRIINKYALSKDYAFQADILRLFLVHEYGGLYLDVDFKYIGPFDKNEFINYEGIFYYHSTDNPSWAPDVTIPNGIFGATKNSKITQFLIDNINETQSWTGPSWMGKTVRAYLNLSEDALHSEVQSKLLEHNISYCPFKVLEQKYVKHLALASWTPENKKAFMQNNINFQKGLK